MKHRSLLFAAATCIVAFSSAVSASAETEGNASAAAYELIVKSTATSLSCDADHQFRREVKICSESGTVCRTLDVSEAPKTGFEAAEDETITILTSVSYRDGGVVFGDAASELLHAGITGSFTHSVAGKGHCMKSISYQLRTAPRRTRG